MELESNVSEVQSGSWRRFIKTKVAPRIGQAKLWDVIASLTKAVYFAVLCTGYGKTIAACGAYAIARLQKRTNRMLVLVPTDRLREQWARDAKKNMAKCGVQILGAYKLQKEPADFRYAHDGMAEVFVATYQQAYTDPEYWERLLSVGHWFVVYDECHRLATEGAWAKNTAWFDSSLRLYLTATPIRHDKRILQGVPGRATEDGRIEYLPDVRIDYGDALKEKAVRPVNVHVYHYFVDVEIDGRIERLTAAKLQAEGVTDFQDYEYKRQLRYKEKYLSPILLGAVSQYLALDGVDPGQHQMLVHAMSCKHAEHVTRVLNSMPDVGPSFADWIGVDRQQNINDAVYDYFETGKLKCLVQIDMAGEGFDNVRCSVGVFLHLIKSASKNTQQIGRHVRRNNALAEERDMAHLFSGADSPFLAVARALEQAAELVLKERIVSDPTIPEEPKQPKIISIAPSSIVNVEFDHVDVHAVGGSGESVDMQKARRGADFLRQSGVQDVIVSAMSYGELARIADNVEERRASSTPSGELFATENEKIALGRERVKKAVGVLARNVVVLRAQEAGDAAGMRVERSLLGDTIRAIHAEWLRQSGLKHDAMTAEELERKHEWVRLINESLKEKGVPGWLQV